MSNTIPYLGCRISLISKSEIRYEGILYTIDPQESIIALAKVQSFGTEDRPGEMAVPVKDEIYEYIIFRGTDIKKIEICDIPKQMPSLHNDPAIVSLQVQSHPSSSGTTSYPGSSFSHQSLGPIGSVGGPYYGNYSQQNLPTSGFSIGTSQPSELSSGIGSSSVGGVSVEPQSSVAGSQPIPAPIGAPPQSGISSHSQQQPQQDILVDVLTGSRSSTPSVSRKSPVVDTGVQVSPPPQQEQAEKKRSNQSSNQRPQQQQQQYTEREPHFYRQGSREGHGNQQSRRGQGGNYYPQVQSNQYQGSRQYQGYYQGNQHQHHQQHHQQQQQYQGQYRGGNMGRGRPSRRPTQSRGRGVFNQGNRQRQDQELFAKEFDFEQGNVQFEELRTQLAKTKITENGDKKDEKKEDSGHETATTGEDSEDSSSSNYYDKTKSFFDSISCEALEKSKGRSQRSDWRQERKINVQTFGVATARRGYYPRGRGAYYGRGGYYRNYNQGFYRGAGNSNYRGRGAMGNSSNYTNGSNATNRSNNVNGAMEGGATGGSSYASAVRSSVAAK